MGPGPGAEAFDIYTDPSNPVRIWEETAPTLVFYWIDILSKSAALDVHDPQDADKQELIRELINGTEPAARINPLAEEEGGDPKGRTFKLKVRRSADVSEAEAVALALGARAEESTTAGELLFALDAARAKIGPVVFSATEWELITKAVGIRHCGDYGQLWWNSESQTVLWVGGDADDPEQGYTEAEEIEELLGSVEGVASVEIYDEHQPGGADDPDSPWVRLPTTPSIG